MLPAKKKIYDVEHRKNINVPFYDRNAKDMEMYKILCLMKNKSGTMKAVFMAAFRFYKLQYDGENNRALSQFNKEMSSIIDNSFIGKYNKDTQH